MRVPSIRYLSRVNFQHWLRRFLLWRSRYISKRNFLLLISVLIGMIAGVASAILKWWVHFWEDLLIGVNEDFSFEYLYLVFPVIGIALTVLFVRFMNHGQLGRGISSIMHAISHKSSILPRDMTYSHLVTSGLTVGFGGSVGLESPIVVTGSAIGSNLGMLFKFNYRERTLLVGCGVAAGISSLFNAPIAGFVFTLEILLLELAVSSFIPVLLASVAGAITTRALSGTEIIFTSELVDPFEVNQIPMFLLLGAFTGLVSLLFIRISNRSRDFFAGIKNKTRQFLTGGVLLGALIFLFPSLYGEGFTSIRALLEEDVDFIIDQSFFSAWMPGLWSVMLYLFLLMLLKIVAANLTQGAGGNGGMFAPSLFIGAVAGFFFAELLELSGLYGLHMATFTLVAMAGVLCGANHAPLTGVFFIAEITSGYELMIPLVIVSALSYITVKYFEPHPMPVRQLMDKGLFAGYDSDSRVIRKLEINKLIDPDIRTIQPEMDLGQLVEVVAGSKRNLFPVVDEEGKFRGIVTLDDIRHLMFKPDKYGEVQVNQLMHPPPTVLQKGDGMEVAMKKFDETNAWNLPVLDGEGYVGMISKSRIFGMYRQLLTTDTNRLDI